MKKIDQSSSKFSVLLSVYNGDSVNHFDQAMESLWVGQSYRPTQIVLICDGPISESHEEVIARWQNILCDVLLVCRNQVNEGLAAALNYGLSMCKYDLVARMDADDICVSDRFEVQVKFMELNPHVAASSGYVDVFDETSSSLRTVPLDQHKIYNYSKKLNPLTHPAVIFRKSIVEKVGGYPNYRTSQDYALWSLLLVKGFTLANVSNVLLCMRGGENLMKRRSWRYFLGEVKVLNFQRRIGFLSVFEFIRNVLSRCIFRLMPTSFKSFIYRHFR